MAVETGAAGWDHPAAFVPVTVTAEAPVPTPIGQVEIILAGDRRVRVTGPVERQMLADVLAVLTVREGAMTC